jgi:hypothetical protein
MADRYHLTAGDRVPLATTDTLHGLLVVVDRPASRARTTA